MKLKSEKASKRWLAAVPAMALALMAVAPSAQAAPRPGQAPKAIVKASSTVVVVNPGAGQSGVSRK